MTDLQTTWVETRAVLGRGEVRMQEALDEIRQVLPFRPRGIDADNGSEFITTISPATASRKRSSPGGPYKKDDNAHIEQTPWPHVRKLVDDHCYDSPAAGAALNALYTGELQLLQNLFLPSVKLVRKERAGATTPRAPRWSACRPARRRIRPRWPRSCGCAIGWIRSRTRRPSTDSSSGSSSSRPGRAAPLLPLTPPRRLTLRAARAPASTTRLAITCAARGARPLR